MKLDYTALLNKMGNLYRLAKLEKGWNIEDLPSGIVSDQVKSLLHVCVQEMNKLNDRIQKLEKK